MGDVTAIEWTDLSFSLWWGCSRVSIECRHCYADTLAHRYGHDVWRRGGPRRMLSDTNRLKPARWNRAAAAAGTPAMVFCSSMSDLFEIHPDPAVNTELDAARAWLWPVIEQTPWLIWQLLTKRPENVAELVPWRSDWPANVWLGTSVGEQRMVEQRLPILASIQQARTRFLSCEPLLGHLDLTPWLGANRAVDWVIAGGESGAKATPMHPAWVRGLRDQVAAADVPFFLKQWGEWAHDGPATAKTATLAATKGGTDDVVTMYRVGKKLAGRTLDGRTWSEFPPVAIPVAA